MPLNKKGEEVPDPEPIALPAGFKVPETMEQMMRRLLKSPEFRDAMNDADVDTFEEAEDFDVDDDTFDPHSPYEEVFDPVLKRGITHQEFQEHRDVYEKRYEDAYAKAIDLMRNSDAVRAILKKALPTAEQSGREATPNKVPAKDKGDSGS